MIEYLQLLTEADEQIDAAAKAELRKKLAISVSNKKDGITPDFITVISKELGISHEDVEKLLIDFAVNYSSVLASVKTEDLDQDALASGTEKEASEHNIPAEIASKIAADHLREDPNYYTAEPAAPAAEEVATNEPPANEPPTEKQDEPAVPPTEGKDTPESDEKSDKEEEEEEAKKDEDEEDEKAEDDKKKKAKDDKKE